VRPVVMLAWHSQVHHLEELGALLTVTDSTAAPESTGEKPTVETSKVCELTPLGFHLGAPRWLTAHPIIMHVLMGLGWPYLSVVRSCR
jgi:hypothetical protein